MANTMGQYRYPGSGLMTEIQTSKSYKSSTIAVDDADAASFKDILISPANNMMFQQNQNYYLKLTIPRDKNYTLSFNVQLLKGSNSAASEYQFLQTITLKPGGTGNNVYNIVLYENLDGEVDSRVPIEYTDDVPNIRNNVYYEQLLDGNYKYYIADGKGNFILLSNLNSLKVVATWLQDASNVFGVFEITFRPVESGFSHILLKMIRTAEDYNIQRWTDNDQLEFGRVVDLDDVTCELFSLTDIVPKLTSTGALSRIGVWAHPGFLMVINGEAIKVTANGYYELDAIPITSLSMIAKDNDYTNFFTLDYEYPVT